MKENYPITLKGVFEISHPDLGKNRKYVLENIQNVRVKERRNRLYLRFMLEDHIMLSIPHGIKPKFVKIKRIIKEET